MASKQAFVIFFRSQPSELYTVEGNRHFMTRRLDRDGEKKAHTQTLAAIYPDADSYEQLIWVCRKLHLPEADCQEVFRRMVFNILANNTDDHNKNFSFIMQGDGSWRLSPAYDITYVLDSGGYIPNEDHCLYIRAKLRNITREDVILFAHDNGIRRPDAIIRDVVGALMQFRSVATKNGVSEQWTGRVEATIITHLKAWEEWEEERQTSILTIDGHDISDFRIEQQLKGNYILQATISGKELRYIIRKKTPEHDLLAKTGLANVTEQMKREFISRFLLPKTDCNM